MPLRVSPLPKQARGLSMQRGGQALMMAKAGRHDGLKPMLECLTGRHIHVSHGSVEQLCTDMCA